jgi:hypothetical protein
MADETHLAVLKEGADAWNAWRTVHRDGRPDLSNASLRGLALANADLGGADLRQADLRGAVLSGATLAGANLTGANFFKTVLDSVDLSGANLVGARFLDCAQLTTRGTGNPPCATPSSRAAPPFRRSPIAHDTRNERHDPAARGTVPDLRCDADFPHLCVEGGTWV